MTARRVLVTGGTGFIGSALVRRLVRDGFHVRVLDDDSRGSISRLADLHGSIEAIAGDVRDAAAVRRAIAGVDLVWHLASVNGTEFFYKRPALVLEVAVKGIVNVVDGCVADGVGELIVASSSEVYQTPPTIPTDESVPMSIPDPLNPRYSYAGAKLITELMAINYGREHLRRVVVFRPHNVFGPAMGWEHAIPQLATRMARLVREHPAGEIPLPIQGSGRETRSFIFIEDFVDALRLLMDRGEHLNIYHLGTTEEVAIGEVAARIAALFGRAARVVPGDLTEGSTTRRCPDTRKLQALGFAPRHSFGEGLAETVAWYREHVDEDPHGHQESVGVVTSTRGGAR